jgi:putative DNA primase/helicase
VSLQAADAALYDQDGRRISGSGEQHSGQVRMAYRLAHSHVDRLLHVHGIGWHYWDGTRWAEDVRGHAERAVLEVLAGALAESVGDKQLRADVGRCETFAGIAGVLSIAAALVEFAATVDDMDADPNLLNTASGVLELDTGRLREHDPRDRLSKVCRAAFDPNADTTVWERFVTQILPDDAERAYLQRVIGQSLYGRVTEHVFPVLTGTGANGKSTLYGALCAALGDYATVIDPALLMTREHGGTPGPELMELLGARLVVGSETQEGRKLDEAVMKRLCGGDALTARRLYREPVTWTPSHTIVYVTNALPKVKGGDPAVWRRIVVVPFGVVVPAEHRDPRLPERLLGHLDAVLLWAVRGWQDYQAGGMRPPASVQRATDDYRTESDAVARFVAEACFTAPSASATTRALFAAWQSWATADGAETLTERAFAKELDRLGFEARRTKIGAVRAGLSPYANEGGDGW